MKLLPKKRERFGNWLRHQLEEHAWSQQDLANRLGTTQPRVNNWVQGKELPNPYNRKRICEALGVAIGELNDILQQVETQEQEAKEDTSQVTPPPSPPHRRWSGTLVRSVRGLVIVALILGIVVGIVVSSTLRTLIPGLWQSCGGTFDDEFHGKLASGWTLINFGGSTTYSLTATGLSLATSADSDLNPHLNLDAPRLLRPITGNFTIQTGLQFRPNTNFQSAGILLWQDQATFMRFERGFGGEKSGIFIQTWDHETFTNVSGLGRHLTTAGSVELRIQRQGDQFTASWRVPGQTWQTEGETDLHFEHLQVGVDLIADYGAPQTTVSYNYFRVSCS